MSKPESIPEGESMSILEWLMKAATGRVLLVLDKGGDFVWLGSGGGELNILLSAPVDRLSLSINFDLFDNLFSFSSGNYLDYVLKVLRGICYS